MAGPYGGDEQTKQMPGVDPSVMPPMPVPATVDPTASNKPSAFNVPMIQAILEKLSPTTGMQPNPLYTLPTQFAPGTDILLRQADLGPQGWQQAQPGSLPPPSGAPFPAR